MWATGPHFYEWGESMRQVAKKPTRMLLAAVGTALGALVVLAQPAMAVGVSNPGSFDATVLAGSSLTLSGGQAFSIGTPACGDGVDNDLVEGIDLADADCTSATDANERLAGNQVFVAPKVTTTIAGTGAISLAVTGIVFPQGGVEAQGLLGVHQVPHLVDREAVLAQPARQHEA